MVTPFLPEASKGRGKKMSNPTFWAKFNEAQSEPGNWRVYLYVQGDFIPKFENLVRLSETEKVPFGFPKLIASIGYDENEEVMLLDFFSQTREMMVKAGVKNIETSDSERAPGLDFLEMGGAGLEISLENPIVNEWNQHHLCKDVFITDVAFMTY
uniref:hypothetical protein n=1 Tax=Algoriphagus sp. TaxID=1872435 RepID=UPI002585DD73|nr:hypothetical protein [Algoriphagus sp.]